MVLSILSVCTIGLNSSHSPVTHRYGARIFSAWPSQVSVFAEGVEFRFVGEARHVHETFLVARTCLLEDRMEARFEIVGVGDASADARLAGRDKGDEERAEAVPDARFFADLSQDAP